jgi:thiosulfate reductase cytochrome b subunit
MAVPHGGVAYVLGIIILYIWTPIHLLSGLLCWYRRHHFPIVGRHFHMTAVLMIIMVICIGWVGYSFVDPSFSFPCCK